MSEESEKAAKWDAVEQYRAAREHLVALEHRMKSIGQKLTTFAETLKQPENFVFNVERQTITVGIPKSNPERPHALVTEADFNFADVSRLLKDYQETISKRNQLTAQLRSAGLPLP